jgi:hypothetical protein
MTGCWHHQDATVSRERIARAECGVGVDIEARPHEVLMRTLVGPFKIAARGLACAPAERCVDAGHVDRHALERTDPADVVWVLVRDDDTQEARRY